MNKNASLSLVAREVGMDYVLFDVRLRLPHKLTLRGYRIVVSSQCKSTIAGRFISLTIDTYEPDYVFRNLTAVTANDLDALQFGASLLCGGAQIEDEAYLGTIALQLETGRTASNLVELDSARTMLFDDGGKAIPWDLH